MFNYNLKSQFCIIGVILCIISCEKYCMDVDFIESKSIEFNTWLLDTSITIKQVNSSVGILDEAQIQSNYRGGYDCTWDDCDNVTQCFLSNATYRFNQFPFQIKIDLNNYGEENGFEFHVNYEHNSNFRRPYRSEFKFVTEKTNANNPTQLIQNFEHLGNFYEEALEVNFNQTALPTEIKKIYVVKEMGIVQLILNNDIHIDLVP